MRDTMRCFGFPTLVALVLSLNGCERKPAPTLGVASASSARSLSDKPRTPEHAPLAGELVDIPGGAFMAGSRPGSPGRQPKIEPEIHELELGPFQIDRLPYPNTPHQAPQLSVSRDEAQRHCATRGARLCTELEWERACKGPASDPYPSGAAWSSRCTQSPTACASGFDVLALGTIREWTASDVKPGRESKERLAAVRGASGPAPAEAHGCARRAAVAESTRASDLGFRCCKGAPNGAAVAEPKAGDTFKKTRIDVKKLESILARYPETKQIAQQVVFFHEPEGARTVVARGPGDEKGFSFTVAPLLWNPVAGAHYLIVTARSGERTSFVVAFYVVGTDDYELAASFIMQNEPGPVAIAYDDYIRPRAHFSSCWGCPGETGKLLYRDHDRIAIVQP